MTPLREALLGLAAAAGAAAIWAIPRLRRVAAIGAAYKAKVLCSIVFGTGRSVAPGTPEEVSADSYWLMRPIRAHINPTTRTIVARLWWFHPRSAMFRDGLGTTLTPPDLSPSVPLVQPATSSSPAVRSGDADWRVSRGSAALDRVVEDAFLEPNPRRRRRTRAVLVVQDGRIVAERYATGFGETTRFPGWSMTKSVLSALVGLLVAEGRLTLEDRALMPGWRDPDARAAITIADLLRMRSGLAFAEEYANLNSDVIEMLFNRADAAAYAASRELAFAPGSVWSYSSGTTNILSAILKRCVGESDYLSWPRRALFDPIGMTSALMEPDASGTFVASSFMLTTARDWARFGQLYLEDGACGGRRLLPEGWVRYCTTPTPQSPDGIYGAHWWLGLKPELGGGTAAAARIPRDAFFAIGHEAQTLTVIPSRRLVVVRLGLSIYIDAWNQAAFLADLLDAL
jgi:CubicO group peptidase (beta-lactamase class C family)